MLALVIKEKKSRKLFRTELNKVKADEIRKDNIKTKLEQLTVGTKRKTSSNKEEPKEEEKGQSVMDVAAEVGGKAKKAKILSGAATMEGTVEMGCDGVSREEGGRITC